MHSFQRLSQLMCGWCPEIENWYHAFVPNMPLMLNLLYDAPWRFAWCSVCCCAGCCCRCSRRSFLVLSFLEVLWYGLRRACCLWSSLRSEVLFGCLMMWSGSPPWCCSYYDTQCFSCRHVLCKLHHDALVLFIERLRLYIAVFCPISCFFFIYSTFLSYWKLSPWLIRAPSFFFKVHFLLYDLHVCCASHKLHCPAWVCGPPRRCTWPE